MRKAYNNLHFVAHLKDYDLSFEYGVGATRQNRMLYNLIWRGGIYFCIGANDKSDY